MLNFEHYNNIESEKERLEVLKKYWGIEENVLQGRVNMISEQSMIFKIYEIKDLDGKDMVNPFNDKLLSINLNKKNFQDELKRLKNNDNVIFTFTTIRLEDKDSSPIDVY